MKLEKSGPSRITRTKSPPKIRKKYYRADSLQPLLIDFGRRCAYCLNHAEMIGGDEAFKVDHFWPREKGGPVADYTNLFLSCDRCNNHKWYHWPTRNDVSKGVRFLNCCNEWDYNNQIFENGEGFVYGTTAAAKYHIIVLMLNRPDLVNLRRRRTQLIKELEETPFKLGVGAVDFQKKLSAIIDLLNLLIPEIAAAP